MTAQQIVPILFIAILSSVSIVTMLFVVLWESQLPGTAPVWAIPILLLFGIGLSLAGIRKLNHLKGQNVSRFLMLVFLCAIPIYLILEVTVM